MNKSSVVTDERNNDTDTDNDTGIPAIVQHQVIYLSLVGIIGIIANLIVLVKSIQYEWSLKRRSAVTRNSTNFLVISLAISDLGTSSFSLALFILPSYVPDFPITQFTCRYMQPLRELFLGVSVFCIALIAVGRYLILLKTFQNRWRIFSSSIANSLLLWILCYVTFALPFSLAYKLNFVDGALICEAEWSTPQIRRAYLTTVMLLNVLLPTLMVCLSYMGIIQRLHKARRVVFPVEMATQEEQGNRLQRHNVNMATASQSHRIVKVSFLLLVAFFVTYVPFAMLFMAIEYGDLDMSTFPQLELIHAIATCLLYSSVILNPLIIIFTSDLYKPKCTFIKKLFTC